MNIPADAEEYRDPLGNAALVYPDGDMLRAVREDFVNLQESPAGFGPTPEDAIAALMEAEGA